MESQNNSQIFLDQPAKDDALGISAYVETLSLFVRQIFTESGRSKEDGPPFFAIGITGDWGSGKSTVLKLLEKRYLAIEQEITQAEADKKAECFGMGDALIRMACSAIISLYYKKFKKPRTTRFLTVNPWEYRWTDDFLSIFSAELENDLKKLTERRRKILQITYWTFWILLSLTLVILGVQNFIDPKEYLGILRNITTWWTLLSLLMIIREYFSKYLEIYKSAKEINNAFKDLFNDEKNASKGIIPSERKNVREKIGNLLARYTKLQKLVFCIDDLDRCDSRTIVSVFSAIKLFLWKSDCVIIIAYDEQIVEHALQSTYKNPKDAHEYLDKIFNMTIPIGQPWKKQIEILSEEMFENDSILEIGDGLKLKMQEGHLKDDLKFLRKNLSKIPVSNPRTIKKISNIFQFFTELYRNLEQYWTVLDADYHTILRIAIIRTCLPAKWIENTIKDAEIYWELLKFCDQKKVREWKKLKLLTELSSESIELLRYSLGKGRPEFLNSYENFWDSYNPKRIHSTSVIKFHHLLKNTYGNGKDFWATLLTFFNDVWQNDRSTENQLCYFKGITFLPWWKRDEYFKYLKRSDYQTFLRIMGLYINFTETYAVANRWKHRPSLDTAIKFIDSHLGITDFKNFKSPFPIARYISVLGEYFQDTKGKFDENFIVAVGIRNIADHLCKLRIDRFEEIVSYLWHKTMASDMIVDSIRRWSKGHWLKMKIVQKAFSPERLFAER